jgi:hypothetical protein
MRGIVGALAAFMLFVLAPSVVYAQATLAGIARDTSGAVLPGVTVEAASPALIEKVRTATTDETGRYSIPNLRPGTYKVTFSLTGFRTVVREGVELSGTAVATASADMIVGGVQETVTVSGETPVVDLQSTTRQAVMNQEIVTAIPSSRTPFTVGVLIPGVRKGAFTGQDVGGSQPPAARRTCAQGHLWPRVGGGRLAGVLGRGAARGARCGAHGRGPGVRGHSGIGGHAADRRGP